jgi:hypothetical protein
MRAEICAGGGLELSAETETELYAMNEWIEAAGPVRVETQEEFMDKRKDEFDKAYEADSKEKDLRGSLWFYTESPPVSEFAFNRAHKDAQKTMNTMLRDFATQTASKPNVTTYSQYEMDGMQKKIAELIADKRQLRSIIIYLHSSINLMRTARTLLLSACEDLKEDNKKLRVKHSILSVCVCGGDLDIEKCAIENIAGRGDLYKCKECGTMALFIPK